MIFAALTQDPSKPDLLEDLHENAQPVDVPWPDWVWWTIGVFGLIVLGLLVWVGIILIRRKPKTAELSPRERALRSLANLRKRVQELEPYNFSVVVSDILRRYISAQYKLPATEQTSQEFLAELSSSAEFIEEDRRLLSGFLERCDLLKFARITGRADENEALLELATSFAQGASK